MEMLIRGDRLGTERDFHVNGNNKKLSWIRASNKHFPWIRARLARSRAEKNDSVVREFRS
jgi:hypothetical protein